MSKSDPKLSTRDTIIAVGVGIGVAAVVGAGLYIAQKKSTKEAERPVRKSKPKKKKPSKSKITQDSPKAERKDPLMDKPSKQTQDNQPGASVTSVSPSLASDSKSAQQRVTSGASSTTASSASAPVTVSSGTVFSAGASDAKPTEASPPSFIPLNRQTSSLAGSTPSRSSLSNSGDAKTTSATVGVSSSSTGDAGMDFKIVVNVEAGKKAFAAGEDAEYGRNGLKRDWPLAFKHYSEALQNGNADACYKMAYAFIFGLNTVEIDEKRAVKILEYGVTNKGKYAVSQLAWCHMNGCGGLVKNTQLAEKMLQDVLKDDVYAQTFQGHMLREGMAGKKDEKAADEMFAKVYPPLQKMVEDGDLLAMMLVAEFYMVGKPVPQDDEKCLDLWRRCAEWGHAEAQFSMFAQPRPGKAHQMDASEVKKNLHWLEKSAKQGFPQAQTEIAMMYLEGGLVPVDQEKAFKLFSSAADKGHPDATAMVATCYANGITVKADLNKARELLEVAAKLESPTGMRELATFYFQGLGGAPRNPQRAQELLIQAADKGDTEALAIIQQQQMLQAMRAQGMQMPQMGGPDEEDGHGADGDDEALMLGADGEDEGAAAMQFQQWMQAQMAQQQAQAQTQGQGGQGQSGPNNNSASANGHGPSQQSRGGVDDVD